LSKYELTYIVRPLEEANLTATSERVNTIVRNAGGELVARNDWGRRRLAYPIRKINDGYYTTLFLNLPGTAVRGIERSLQLSEDILRYLVVRVDTFRLPTTPATETPAAAESVPAAPASEPVAVVEQAAPVAEASTETAAEGS